MGIHNFDQNMIHPNDRYDQTYFSKLEIF